MEHTVHQLLTTKPHLDLAEQVASRTGPGLLTRLRTRLARRASRTSPVPGLRISAPGTADPAESVARVPSVANRPHHAGTSSSRSTRSIRAAA